MRTWNLFHTPSFQHCMDTSIHLHAPASFISKQKPSAPSERMIIVVFWVVTLCSCVCNYTLKIEWILSSETLVPTTKNARRGITTRPQSSFTPPSEAKISLAPKRPRLHLHCPSYAAYLLDGATT
jgi:hypothetical protein